MKRLFILFFLFQTYISGAQDIDGTWTGNFIQYIHNTYDVQLVVEKLAPGNIFSARLRIMDDYYYGEYNVSGFICNKRYLEITTIVLLRESGSSNWIDCLNGTFDLNEDETELTFTDTWLQKETVNNACKVKYIQKDMFQCLRSAYLHKAKYREAIVEFEKKWNQTITQRLNTTSLQQMLQATKLSPKVINKVDSTKTATFPPVASNKSDIIPSSLDDSFNITPANHVNIASTIAEFNKTETKIVAKNEDRAPIIDTFDNIQTRPVYVKDEIEVNSADIIIEYWDRYNEDGDSVNLYLNKKPILQNVLLTKAKKVLNVHLEKVKNYLVLDAINLGKEPPNTASITVKDGKKIQNVSLTSTMKTSGALKIILKK